MKLFIQAGIFYNNEYISTGLHIHFLMINACILNVKGTRVHQDAQALAQSAWPVQTICEFCFGIKIHALCGLNRHNHLIIKYRLP